MVESSWTSPVSAKRLFNAGVPEDGKNGPYCTNAPDSTFESVFESLKSTSLKSFNSGGGGSGIAQSDAGLLASVLFKIKTWD